MKRLVRNLIGLGVLAWTFTASATPVTFDLDGSSSSVEVVNFNSGLICGLVGCGIDVELNSQLDSLSATLNPGDSWSFAFFDLSFWGLGGGTGTIAATLGFDTPLGAPVASGSGSGSFGTLFGALTGGSLSWITQPGTFWLADGTGYSVVLEDLFGLTGSSATVNGTITLIQGPNGSVSVPEPGTMGLLGLALLGMGLSSRRKKQAA